MRALFALVLVAAACGGSSSPAPVAPSNTPANAPPTAPAPTSPAATAPPAAEGSSGSAAMPPLTDAEFDARMNRLIDILSEASDAITAAGTDCRAAADGLAAVTARHDGFLAEMKAREADDDLEVRINTWMNTHMDRLMKVAMPLAEASQRCDGEPRFREAMARLSGDT